MADELYRAFAARQERMSARRDADGDKDDFWDSIEQPTTRSARPAAQAKPPPADSLENKQPKTLPSPMLSTSSGISKLCNLKMHVHNTALFMNYHHVALYVYPTA